jgi:hypothetical protein
MIRSLSILLIIVGFVWALVVAWAFVSLSGLSVPVSTRAVIFDYGLALIGPVCLILGPILILSGSRSHTGATLVLLACLVLTGIMVYQLAPSLHPKLLQMRPPYVLYAVLMVLVLLVDVGAYRVECVKDKKPGDRVFTWADDKPVTDFRRTWRTLAKKAEIPDLIFHDLRRSAVRNMVRAGISKHVAKLISGHQTDSVFDRYDITDATDLMEATRTLEARNGHKLGTPETAGH